MIYRFPDCIVINVVHIMPFVLSYMNYCLKLYIIKVKQSRVVGSLLFIMSIADFVVQNESVGFMLF